VFDGQLNELLNMTVDAPVLVSLSVFAPPWTMVAPDESFNASVPTVVPEYKYVLAPGVNVIATRLTGEPAGIAVPM
jgi:hypothetical protein